MVDYRLSVGYWLLGEMFPKRWLSGMVVVRRMEVDLGGGRGWKLKHGFLSYVG